MEDGNQQHHKKIEQQKQIYYIDSHAHLLDYQRQSPLILQNILQQCAKSNIKYIVANTCCTNQFIQMQKITSSKFLSPHNQQIVNIIPCYGIHPCYICEQIKHNNNQNLNKQLENKQSGWKALLKQYLLKNQNAQIGEIGLDFRKDVIQGNNSKEDQWNYFQFQFQLAIQLKRSVTIHCVRAYGQLLKYFKKVSQKYTKQQLSHFSIILHSYGGSSQITKSLLKLQKLNIYFSLSLKHSKDILTYTPLDKILLQTDAPYQNDYDILIENGLYTKNQLQLQKKEYEELETNIYVQKQGSNYKGLLKQCKFFNKSVLDNRPMNVITNYKQVLKSFNVSDVEFHQKVTLNFLKAFKLLK